MPYLPSPSRPYSLYILQTGAPFRKASAASIQQLQDYADTLPRHLPLAILNEETGVVELLRDPMDNKGQSQTLPLDH